MNQKILNVVEELRKGFTDTETLKKEMEELRTKANEVMNTGATNFGKELIPTNVMGNAVTNMIPQYATFFNMLSGNHGSGMAVSEKVPVIGEATLFSGNTEWTTGTGITTPDGSGVRTDEVTITQAPFILNIAISKRELNYTSVKLESIVRERIGRSMALTIETAILNGDTASSGNVNLDGGTPSTTAPYMQNDNGLRKLGIANGADLGTFDEDDLADLQMKLGAFGSRLQDLLFVCDMAMWNKIRKLPNVKTYDKAAQNATLITGIMGNIWGIEIMVVREYPSLTASNGKVSSTGASNTKGSITLFYLPAIQYGFGQDLEIETTSLAGKGIMLTATYEFGFAIVNGQASTDKTVTTGYNVTL